MGLPNGIHHLAICTKDIKQQIEFFTDVVRGLTGLVFTGCMAWTTPFTAFCG